MPDRSYEVPTVSCQGCKDSIEAALGGLPGLERVEVDLGAKRVTVTGDAPDDAVRTAIEATGYRVSGVVLA